MVLTYQWEIVVAVEVLSLVALLLFGFVRYFWNRRRTSLWFLLAFLVLLAFEAALAILIYLETGEISTFQIVITILSFMHVRLGSLILSNWTDGCA